MHGLSEDARTEEVPVNAARVGTFADGLADRAPALRIGRFGDGLSDHRAPIHVGTFAEGMVEAPEASLRVGRFSDGLEERLPATLRRTLGIAATLTVE
jgi:hypothetical protein